jgi:hypothetical protein
MDTTRIVLPIATLWQNGLQTTNNMFNVELKKANSVTDQYIYNNKYSSSFTVPEIITGSVTVEFKTNNNPTENTYKILDDNGNVVTGGSSLATANTIYVDNYVLNGCYKLIVTDAGGDGVQWWANTAQGVGYIKLKDALGNVIKTFQPDFGDRFEYSFTTISTVSINENELGSKINVYPNPSHTNFFITGDDLENAEISFSDVLGRTIEIPMHKEKEKMEFNSKTLNPGVYILTISKNNQTATKKIIIN